jgi:homoserine O-acetyltransferase/O-succinyltransferase
MTPPLFDSSDSVRHARPLRHLQTVTFEEPFPLELGGSLPGITIAYETYGRLAPNKDNAVLVCHAISGDSHVAAHDPTDDPGWWEVLVGPGLPIDTDRFFVICSNLLGGCRGSTGPGSLNPATGKPYGRDFPTVTLTDMVEAQHRLLTHLGIPSLLAIVGGSLGGHQALTWATRFPTQVRGVAALATSARLTSQALAFDVVGRNAIRRDPHYHGGQHYDQEQKPEVGLAIARMIGHITYLSREAMTRKFDANRLQPRDVATEFEKTFSVGSYLGYQGARFVERFDANSYIVLSMAMDLFDLGATPAELAAALQPARCRWLIVSFTSDWLFPPEQSRDLVDALLANQASVSYANIASDCGHDAFLLPDNLDRYGELVRGFLNQLTVPDPSPTPPVAVDPDLGTDTPEPATSFHRRRLDYDRMVELIPPNTSVLDLGCGSGRLLARLRQRPHSRLVGIELDERKVIASVQRGLDVIQADLNRGLPFFGDGEFDCVVLSLTLQAVRDVERVIHHMLRVGRLCIVSFPNLAFRERRRLLAQEGRAPTAWEAPRTAWCHTADIRFLSLLDFEEFCQQQQIQIQRRIALDTHAGIEVLDQPNLDADLAIFVISRAAKP